MQESCVEARHAWTVAQNPPFQKVMREAQRGKKRKCPQYAVQ
jgi:hypothetical protein